MMDGSTTVKEMARRTADRFPMRFASVEQSLEQVRFVSNTYGLSMEDSFQTEVLL